ncbi:MAG: Fic family protein [Alysiella sp.]|uniref:Fic family protein n=1 Tax=Alysiella sp. TaxID=1872483 RepID=UPI0026DC85DF|nr:Fic family protein [Alysiella sp.]MDO4434613.1 Fic family protein [Alysiella sp.]
MPIAPYCEKRYIWQDENWADWYYNANLIQPLLNEIETAHQNLLNRIQLLGYQFQIQTELETAIVDVIKTSEIEGEYLNHHSVRSSLGHRLGVDVGAVAKTERDVEGVVDMVLDATRNCHLPLTHERLCTWHQNLFPDGKSDLYAIDVGHYRSDKQGVMQIVSGSMGREKVHYIAPPAEHLLSEMNRFLDWVNTDNQHNPYIKAALSHLWFECIHPFDDGNGRIGRAISDMLLARADNMPQRLYSTSAQIEKDRKSYYEALNQCQNRHGNQDVSEWLYWFLDTVADAIEHSHIILNGILMRQQFWQKWPYESFNLRQQKVLSKLLDGFEGLINHKKWKNIAKCTYEETQADIADLIERGVLHIAQTKGRTAYFNLDGLDTSHGLNRDGLDDADEPPPP